MLPSYVVLMPNNNNPFFSLSLSFFVWANNLLLNVNCYWIICGLEPCDNDKWSMLFCVSSERLACACVCACGIENVHVVLIKMGKFLIFFSISKALCVILCVCVCVFANSLFYQFYWIRGRHKTVTEEEKEREGMMEPLRERLKKELHQEKPKSSRGRRKEEAEEEREVLEGFIITNCLCCGFPAAGWWG